MAPSHEHLGISADLHPGKLAQHAGTNQRTALVTGLPLILGGWMEFGSSTLGYAVSAARQSLE